MYSSTNKLIYDLNSSRSISFIEPPSIWSICGPFMTIIASGLNHSLTAAWMASSFECRLCSAWLWIKPSWISDMDGSRSIHLFVHEAFLQVASWISILCTHSTFLGSQPYSYLISFIICSSRSSRVLSVGAQILHRHGNRRFRPMICCHSGYWPTFGQTRTDGVSRTWPITWGPSQVGYGFNNPKISKAPAMIGVPTLDQNPSSFSPTAASCARLAAVVSLLG